MPNYLGNIRRQCGLNTGLSHSQPALDCAIVHLILSSEPQREASPLCWCGSWSSEVKEPPKARLGLTLKLMLYCVATRSLIVPSPLLHLSPFSIPVILLPPRTRAKAKKEKGLVAWEKSMQKTHAMFSKVKLCVTAHVILGLTVSSSFTPHQRESTYPAEAFLDSRLPLLNQLLTLCLP